MLENTDMCYLLINQNVFHNLPLNKNRNIFLIKHFLLGYILAVGGWWLNVVDIFWLSMCSGGWWWVYFAWWWMVVDVGEYILVGGGWLWLVVDGGGW